jgi:acyl phosphate:glycerol-3-phosphate acyltransferase
MSLWAWPTPIALIAGYLLGSIPTAIWISRFVFGVDILQVGSKNPGMTNVWRTLGWKPALPVAILDAAKGSLAALIGLYLGKKVGAEHGLALSAGVAAVLGHSFSFLAKFRGGKSVLTAFGIFLALTPSASLIALAAWALVMWRSRVVSLASLTAAIVLPPLVYLESRYMGRSGAGLLFQVAFLVGVWVIVRHRANIVRLLKGTEPRFGKTTP